MKGNMKIADLFKNPIFLAKLKSNPPLSKFSGNPMTLVHMDNGCSLCWENCSEPDWWAGWEDGVMTKQDRRWVSNESVLAAAQEAGIDTDIVALALANLGAEMDAAQAAYRAAWAKREGFESYESMQQAELERRAKETELRQSKTRGVLIEKYPYLTDKALAEAAEKELSALFSRHPHIDSMTRKLDLIDANGVKLAKFTNRDGMRAWLFQHGHNEVGIDNRHAFVESCK